MIRLAKAARIALAGGLLLSLTLVAASAADIGTATVNTDVLRLRAQANTQSTILDMAERGRNVTLLEDAGDGWYKVRLGNTVGYMSGEFLNVTLTSAAAEETPAQAEEAAVPEEVPADTAPEEAAPAEDPADEPAPLYGKVDVGNSVLNVRSGPGTDHAKLGTLANGRYLELLAQEDGWYRFRFGEADGYVSSEYITLVAESDLPSWFLASGETDGGLGTDIVDYAKSFLGVPYRWGGTSPSGFDCSGLVYYVYKHFGYALNRGATGQLSNGVSVGSMYDLIPGDLVFFYDGKVSTPVSHVGIYIGDGQFIHASTGDGRDVQIDPLFTGHYAKKYVYGRRII